METVANKLKILISLKILKLIYVIYFLNLQNVRTIRFCLKNGVEINIHFLFFNLCVLFSKSKKCKNGLFELQRIFSQYKGISYFAILIPRSTKVDHFSTSCHCNTCPPSRSRQKRSS